MNVNVGDSWPGRQLLITQRLRDRRADLGLTQKQIVSRLARRGIRTTNRALSSLEHGAGLDVAKLPDLAAALDCTVTYLVGLTEDPYRWEPDPGASDGPRSRSPEPARPGRAATTPPSMTGNAPVRSLIIGADVPDRGLHLGTDGDSG